jgi:DnaJ-domain-containing protein 1
MKRIQLFLMIDGAVVLAFGIFILAMLNRKQDSHFRDDLWAERKKAEKEGKLPEFEAKVDQKILLEHRPDPKEREPEPQETAGFRVPNFRGKPHEILGIPAGADAALINKAYKHWIKRYHPDRVTHLGKGYVEQARRRAEQLNTARQAMLQGGKKG